MSVRDMVGAQNDARIAKKFPAMWKYCEKGYTLHAYLHCVQKQTHTFCFISPCVMCRFKQKLQ